ncbi:MAG: Polynucleotide 5'-hydroxyl-kinase grc3 [Bathelium mastoideum]|nr:MAG: Polynucleotide 5'-hydroxyl-kinase grc3 [Bathelium mastoideum]
MAAGKQAGNFLTPQPPTQSAFAVARAKRERQEPNNFRFFDEEISSANVSEVDPPLSIDQDNSPESTSSSQSELETDVNDGVQRTKAEPFTIWEPSDGTIQRVDDGVIVFMRNGDKITLLGQYGLQVRDGEVHIYGAVLKKSEAIYLVSCPTTHALPSLSCGSDAAKIRITRCSQSIRNLRTLSPLFCNIWDHHGSISTATKLCAARDGFCLVPSSRTDTFSKNMFPLFLSPERAAIIQKVCDMENGRVPTILVCGAKSTGKSTLGRMILNRLVTTRPSHKPEWNVSYQPVFFLDLNPAQPEFGPPGLVSLIQIRRPILGPPFSHAETTVTPTFRLIHAHTLTALSPNEDPLHFLQAANQLMQEYHHALARAPGIPLVVNYPSWATGLGLDTLVQFIEKWKPSDVVHLDSGHEGDAVALLTQVAGNNFVHSLHSPEFRATMRTPAQLATMQAISYFHSKGVASDENMRWNPVPLAEWKPWIVRYGEQSPGILGLMLYGENIAPEFLEIVFDGNLVSMVVLEDESALAVPQIFRESGSEVDDNANNEACQSKDLKGSPTTQGLSHSQTSQWPCLRRTPKENLPYILTGDYGYTTPLDPCKSYTIGQALIRGIDVEQQVLYLVTPVSRSIMENLRKNRKTRFPNIVLVRGRWEAPQWALGEDSPWGSSREARWSETSEAAVGNESRPVGGREDVNGSDVIMTDGDHGPSG